MSSHHPLLQWAKRNKVSAKAVARALDVSPVALHWWSRGKWCPSPASMVRITNYTAGEVMPNDCVLYWYMKQQEFVYANKVIAEQQPAA